MLLRPDTNVVTSEFLTWMINSDYVYKQAKNVASGTTNPHINIKEFKKFKALIPPINLQKKFSSFLQTYNELRERQLESDGEIDRLFHSLMHKAFSGELKLN